MMATRTRAVEAKRILGYREEQVLELARADLEERGRVRSYRAIAVALGMRHRSHVADVIGRLERRGLLIRVGSGSQWRIRLADGCARNGRERQSEISK